MATSHAPRRLKLKSTALTADQRKEYVDKPAAQDRRVSQPNPQLLNNCMSVTRIVGFVSPPFSPQPLLSPVLAVRTGMTKVVNAEPKPGTNCAPAMGARPRLSDANNDNNHDTLGYRSRRDEKRTDGAMFNSNSLRSRFACGCFRLRRPATTSEARRAKWCNRPTEVRCRCWHWLVPRDGGTTKQIVIEGRA